LQWATEPVGEQPRQRARRIGWGSALGWASALVLAVALVIMVTRGAPPAREVVRFAVAPPDNHVFASLRMAGAASISPDGRRLAFVAKSAQGRQVLWIRPLDSLAARSLPGTEDAFMPFWSPDSAAVAFFAQGQLKRIALAGGRPQVIADSPSGRGGAWNRDGIIIFAPRETDALYQVPASGGTPRPVTTLDRAAGDHSHREPQFLPDGRHFIFFAFRGARGRDGIYVGSLDSPKMQRMVQSDGAGIPVSSRGQTGYLVYPREGALLAQRFDAGPLRLAGEPVVVAQEISILTNGADFSVSQNGVLTYRAGEGAALSQLVWLDRNGRQLATVGPPGRYNSPALSPDARTIATNRDGDVWLVDQSRNAVTRFTFAPASRFASTWTPDGSHIILLSVRAGQWTIYQKAVGGSGGEEILFQSSVAKRLPECSPDGRYLLFEQLEDKTGFDLWLLPLAGDRKPAPLLQTPFDEREAQFYPKSGDETWIAYASNESGQWEVYVQAFNLATGKAHGKSQISTGGGFQPRWRGDGKELFYLAENQKLMATPFKVEHDRFEAGTPVPLFTTNLFEVSAPQSGFNYCVTGDGRRFLVNSSLGEQASSPVTVVLNWSEGLKR
jgi:Tol biopolymer transport system component